MTSPRTVRLIFDRERFAADELPCGHARQNCPVVVACVPKAAGVAIDDWKTGLVTLRLEIKKAAWPQSDALAAVELDAGQIIAAPTEGPQFSFSAAQLALDLGQNGQDKFWLVLWGTAADGAVVDFGEAWLVVHEANASSPITALPPVAENLATESWVTALFAGGLGGVIALHTGADLATYLKITLPGGTLYLGGSLTAP